MPVSFRRFLTSDGAELVGLKEVICAVLSVINKEVNLEGV